MQREIERQKEWNMQILKQKSWVLGCRHQSKGPRARYTVRKTPGCEIELEALSWSLCRPWHEDLLSWQPSGDTMRSFWKDTIWDLCLKRSSGFHWEKEVEGDQGNKVFLPDQGKKVVIWAKQTTEKLVRSEHIKDIFRKVCWWTRGKK